MIINSPTARSPHSPGVAVAADLWHTAERFRAWVTSELSLCSGDERLSIRGDYLFVIDNEPRFVVILESTGAWSGVINDSVNAPEIHLDPTCPVSFSAETARAFLSDGARTTVTTDSDSLHRLLSGTLRARVAFLTGRVKIRGDLAAFMLLVSLAKRRGVRVQ